MNGPEPQGREARVLGAEPPGEHQSTASALSSVSGVSRQKRVGALASGPLSAHLFERTEHDRADGPDDDRWAERNERWFGWGEDWDTE